MLEQKEKCILKKSDCEYERVLLPSMEIFLPHSLTFLQFISR